MPLSLNVRFILQLSCVIAIVTTDGNNTAPVSTPAPSKKSEKAIIVNVSGISGDIEIANVKDSHNTEKAIKSLEATLKKNFQKLIRVVNGTSRGKPNVESGMKYSHLFGFPCLFLAKNYCILSWTVCPLRRVPKQRVLRRVKAYRIVLLV